MKPYSIFYFLFSIFFCSFSCARGKEPGECVVSGDPFMEFSTTNTQIVIFDEAVEIPAQFYKMPGVEILSHLKMAVVDYDENLYEMLLNEPAVINVVPDLKFRSIAESTVVKEPTDEEKASWGVDRVKAPALWKLGFRGQGVRVAVFDSGVLPNFPDLGIRVVKAKNFTSADGDDWIDQTGHGTSVASIIAATENGEFTRGVAPEVLLFVARVLDKNNWVADSYLVRAIEWAIDNNVRIANMSLGQYQGQEVLDRALTRSMGQGLLVGAAAVNEGDLGSRGSNVIFPAKHTSVMAVSAMDTDDSIAGFSSHGPEVDIAAPGENLGDLYSSKPLVYGVGGGTSYAAPHVTGVAALILSYAPRLTPYQLFTVLTLSAEDLGALGKDDYYGYGVVNAQNALIYIEVNNL